MPLHKDDVLLSCTFVQWFVIATGTLQELSCPARTSILQHHALHPHDLFIADSLIIPMLIQWRVPVFEGSFIDDVIQSQQMLTSGSIFSMEPVNVGVFPVIGCDSSIKNQQHLFAIDDLVRVFTRPIDCPDNHARLLICRAMSGVISL